VASSTSALAGTLMIRILPVVVAMQLLKAAAALVKTIADVEACRFTRRGGLPSVPASPSLAKITRPEGRAAGRRGAR
jgi:hypothetical protein